jgi:hypothetical protein
MSKKANAAVMAMKEKDLEQAKVQSQTIAEYVKGDMQIAENGMFHALRAGIGLLRIKELYQHGDWANTLMDLFPDRSASTLRRYMQVGTNFLEAKQIGAGDAWIGMQAIRTDRLLADPDGDAGRKGADKTNPLERDVGEFVREFGSIRQAIKGEAADGRDLRVRKLTKTEMIEAARAVWNKYANIIQEEALNRMSIGLLPYEDLDAVASTIRLAYDAMRKELASRRG